MNIRGAVLQMALARQASVVVMALALVLLGRLLSPQDFGVFAAMFAIIALAEMLVRFGITAYLVRLPRIAPEDIRAGQGLALALGLGSMAALLTAMVFLPAGIWPEGGRQTLAILGLSLPLLAAIETLEVAFSRELRVRALAYLAVARQIADSATAVAMALAGFGAPALAFGILAQRALGAAVLWWISRHGHGYRPALRGWSRFFRFSGVYLGVNAAGRLGDAGVVFLLARMLGVDLLGQFNRAKRILALLDDTLLAGIEPVVLPALSRSIDGGIARDRVYLAKVDYLAGLCWPGFAFIALMAEELVLLLLGAQWAAAVPAVQMLAVAGLVLPISKMSVKMFVAIDAVPAYARIQIVHQLARLSLVALGALHSLEAACLGAALSSYLKAGMVSVALKRRIGYCTRALGRVALGAGAVTLAALAGPVALKLWAPDWPGALVLGAAILSAALGWVTGSLATRHALLTEALAAIGATRLADRLRPVAAT